MTRVLHTAYCILHTVRITSIYIQKYHAIDIADPSSMQDACHLNFVIDLAHRRVLWLSGRASERNFEGLRFDSS